MSLKNKQVQLGAAFSYILIFLNATYGLFLTPYIIGQIGQASYGVYKTISAFTASLMVLDLGIGGTMMRYIAKYRADKEDSKIPNFIFMGLVQTSAVCAVVGVVTSVLYFFLDEIYSTGLTPAELDKAKQLYIFLILGMLAHILQNFTNGIISGYNRFIFANGIKIVRLVVRIVLVVVLLGIYKDPLTLILIDLLLTIAFILAELYYLTFVLKTRIRFTHWDRFLFSESLKYTMLMFLTTLVVEVNTNFSNVIIGASINSVAVTVYSMAILIFGMFQQLSTAISGVMLPTVTNTLKTDDDKFSKTVALVTRVGRIQFLLLGAALAGFLVLGKPFIEIWLGSGFEDVYPIVLILLGPALLELCVNVCLSILRAKNLLGFRTAIITIFAGLNLLITLFGIKTWGYFAPAVGTAISILFGSVITMGIYYYKKFKINLLKLYMKIFKRIWFCIVLSAMAALGISLLVNTSLQKFILGFVAFIITYAITLLLFGLTHEEKNTILSKLRRKKND